MLFLKTTWFGVFLYTDSQLSDSIIFPKDETEIKKRIESIFNQQVLPEEKQLLKKKNVIVQEKRLAGLGQYEPHHPIFSSLDPHPEEYGFSVSMIQSILQRITMNHTQKQLEDPTLHLIQMVNALDELQQIANLLTERRDHWSQLPDHQQPMQPVTSSLDTIIEETAIIQQHIEKHMASIAPNITSVTGPLIGARLIAQAGSLQRLAQFPSSTIQILGAEKAFFRYQKEGGKPPKHGIIYQHNSVNRAPRKQRGKKARQLANTISLAAKADAFTHRDITKLLQEEKKC